MNSLIEITASTAILNSASKSLKTVVVNSMGVAAAVIELWDSTGTDAAGGARRICTLQSPANQTWVFNYTGAAISQGLYIKFVSGTTPRVSYEIQGA